MELVESPGDNQPLGLIQQGLKQCICQSIVLPDDSRCNICNAVFASVSKLTQEKSYLTQELSNTRQKLDNLISREQTEQDGKRLRLLEEQCESKEEQMQKMKEDMEILGQKLIDEIEKRAELQHNNESVHNELEELTQTLFEEANTLVAKEARERHGAQQKQSILAKELGEMRLHLQMEQNQVRELRIRISELQLNHDNLIQSVNLAKAKKIPTISIPGRDGKVEDLIDPQLFGHFEELLERASKLKMTKLNDLLYMRNTLEDEVTPCLKFGGNPRTSTKKFIEAIIANTCFIEEMSDEQVQELVERDIINAKTSQMSLEIEEAPTANLFNKTMLERIAHALTPIVAIPPDEEGCSTCGREEKYRFQFKISDVQQDSWYPICINCRDRLLSVVQFYQFIRNLRQGLFSSRNGQDLYLEALSLKRAMWFTRIGVGSLQDADSLFRMLRPVCPNSSIQHGPLSADLDITPVDLKFQP